MICNNMLSLQHQASNTFRQLHAKSIRSRILSLITGRYNHLLDLNEVEQQRHVQSRRYAGTQAVPIDAIQGSEGRCHDFDSEFRPLKNHNRLRWISIAVARERGTGLPAVDLIQVDDVYFVRDGHHRISVAKLYGQVEIDATVTVWACENAPPDQAASSDPTDRGGLLGGGLTPAATGV